MSNKRRKLELRFAVGTADKPFGPTWTLWSNRRDIYLAARDQRRYLKVSLHEKWWGAAFTAESGIVISETDSRNIRVWGVPSESSPGWTRGPVLSIARLLPVEDYDLLPEDPGDKPVTWLQPPKYGHTTEIQMWISGTRDHASAVVYPPADHYVSIRTADGRTIWLWVKTSRLDLSVLYEQRKLLKDLQLTFSGDPGLDRMSGMVYSIQTGPLGTPEIVQVALTSKNVTWTTEASGRSGE